MQSSEILISFVVFAFVGFILYLFAAQDRAKIRYRAEVQKELIAKFSSSQELGQFLNSEAGMLLIRGSKVDEVRQLKQQGAPKTAHEIVGLAISWGVLILAIGCAIFVVRGLTMTSAILIALGIGFEVNAAIGYVYSKKLGAWNPPSGPTSVQPNGS